jgi:hypothetical protein
MSKPAFPDTAPATATATSGIADPVATEATATEGTKFPEAETKAVPVVRPESFGGENTSKERLEALEAIRELLTEEEYKDERAEIMASM